MDIQTLSSAGAINESEPIVQEKPGHRVSRALLAVLLLLPIYVGRVHELFHFLDGLPIAKVATGLALLVIFFDGRRQKGFLAELVSFPQVRNLSWLLVFAVLSLPFSVWRGASVDFLADFLKNLLFIMLMLYSVRSESDVRKVAWALILSAFMLTIGSFIEPQFVEDGRVYVINGFDPNEFALFLLMVLSLALFVMEGEKGWRKLLLIGIILLGMVAIFRTGSRGGLIALLGVAAILMSRKGLKYAIAVSPAVMLLAVILLMNVDEARWERFATILSPEQDYNTTDSTGRIEVWKNGIELFFANPLFGVGMGVFPVAEGIHHGREGKWSAAHNAGIQVGAELGVGGLIMFLLLLSSSISAVRRNGNGPPWLRRGVEFGLYVYCIGAFFLSWAYALTLYFFVALSVICARLGRESLKARAHAGSNGVR
ncbi:MAG TPA: O-antigen ligase family protein [Dissulfurispiraceae bacterium]|nr:O-antigen ligase family protein [Dissulfurispiraceae bacterium]